MNKGTRPVEFIFHALPNSKPIYDIGHAFRLPQPNGYNSYAQRSYTRIRPATEIFRSRNIFCAWAKRRTSSMLLMTQTQKGRWVCGMCWGCFGDVLGMYCVGDVLAMYWDKFHCTAHDVNSDLSTPSLLFARTRDLNNNIAQGNHHM